MSNNSPIDFVIIWVDGSDPQWLAEKRKYSADTHSDDRDERYRDWELLTYWFRGVEKFAPWVNKVHFVTWGHIPKWLNTSHPKLNIVRHEDYIPKEYLPTFSSHPIELNLHRIEGLADNFVYFNDDMFIISDVKSEDYFKNDIPCDSACLNVHCYSPDVSFHMCPYRDIGLINRYFDMKTVIKKDLSKWINLKYGKELLRTLALLPCPRFPGMWQHHLPSSFKKETFEKLWSLEYDELNETCSHKFRNLIDYNQWLFREWQIAQGNFIPRKISFGKSMALNSADECKLICNYITKQKGKNICINDGKMSYEDYEKYKSALLSAFSSILPDKSGFEL